MGTWRFGVAVIADTAGGVLVAASGAETDDHADEQPGGDQTHRVHDGIRNGVGRKTRVSGWVWVCHQ
jgi:hypothetical protein